jgi:hypothetical protein
MKKLILVLCGVLTYFLTFGQTSQIKTIDQSSKDYYPWITYLNEGPINWIESQNEGSKGISFRLIITTSEIYDDIKIEKATVGEEGGGKKIISKRLVDRESLRAAFDLKGEISGITFKKWLTPTSFELIIQDKTLIFENIDKDTISVKKQK